MNKNTKMALAAAGGALIVVGAVYFMMGSDNGAADLPSQPDTGEVAAEDSDLQDAAEAPRRGSGASSGSANRSGRLEQGQQSDDLAAPEDSSEVQQQKTKRPSKKPRRDRRNSRSNEDEDDASENQGKGEVPPASVFDGDN